MVFGDPEVTRAWFSLMDFKDEVASDYVPCMNFPDLFFMEGSGRQLVDDIALAKSACAGCPIVKQCLDFALFADEGHGIWGGLTPNERRKLKGQKVRRR